MTKLTRRAFAASAACSRGRHSSLARPAFAQAYPAAAGHGHLPVGRGRRHRRHRAHRRGAAGKGTGPAVQRREPHRRLGRGRSLRHRDRAARRLHDRHDHGRNHDDALAGPHRVEPEELHPAGADERRSARHPGQRLVALQEREGTRRRHQGALRRQDEGLRHRPGRHLAPRAGRLAQGDGPRAEPRGAGCRRTARRPPMQDLAAGGLDMPPARCRKRARSSRPARPARSPSMAPSAIRRSRTSRR